MGKSNKNNTSSFEVSIVIPLFNKEETIQRSIKSILNQTHPVTEIIVVDDGSTDQSVLKVKEIDDPRIKIITQTNGGPSSARNTGINAAKTVWVAFIDADDEWMPEYIEEIWNLHKAFPKCGVLTSTYQVDKNGGEKNDVFSSNFPRESKCMISDYYATRCTEIFHHVSSTVCRKQDLLSVGGFKAGVHHFEDFLLWLDLTIITDFALVNTPLAIYHSSPSGLSKEVFALGEQITPAKLLYSQIRQGLIPQRLLESAKNLLSKFQLDEARHLYRYGDKQSARKAYFQRQKTTQFEKDWQKVFLVSCLPNWLYKFYLSFKDG